jgi:hypothetical protein
MEVTLFRMPSTIFAVSIAFAIGALDCAEAKQERTLSRKVVVIQVPVDAPPTVAAVDPNDNEPDETVDASPFSQIAHSCLIGCAKDDPRRLVIPNVTGDDVGTYR